MGDLSLHFNRSEFACSCRCGMDTVDGETLDVLEGLRSFFGQSITINSGNRCKAHNANVGGGKTSQHLYGRAADIVVDSIPPQEVQSYLENKYPGRYGIGSYDTFTHIDTKSGPARRW
jgi:uncharacterized protein YcbK (DUF882 family)